MYIEKLKHQYYNMLTSRNNEKTLNKLKQDLIENRDLLLVHQMGRAASMTITNTLRSMDLLPQIYHTHWLNKSTVKERMNSVKKGLIPLNVRVSNLVSPEIYKNPESRNWKFISIIREPVARNVSAFFLSAHLFIPDFFNQWKQGKLSLDQILDVFLKDYPHQIPLTWFEKEVKEPIGIDFYDSDFDHNKGYSMINKGNFSFLVLKLEKLQECYSDAFQFFLKQAPESLVNTHITEKDDEHSELYKKFIQKVELPNDYLDEMYGSQYATHFYTETEITHFRKKWSKK